MTCPARDQDLLLLAHGALSPLRRLATLLHMRRCSECQARYTQLGATSHAVAGVLRGAGPPHWAPPAPAGVGLPSALMIALVTVVVLVLFLGTLYVARVRSAGSNRPPTAASPRTGCLPGLPNDACR